MAPTHFYLAPCRAQSAKRNILSIKIHAEPGKIRVEKIQTHQLKLLINTVLQMSRDAHILSCPLLLINQDLTVFFKDYAQDPSQSCEMSNLLHRQKFEFKLLPQKRVIRN